MLPPIGKYFTTNERLKVNIVRKLLKYGARIVIKVFYLSHKFLKKFNSIQNSHNFKMILEY